MASGKTGQANVDYDWNNKYPLVRVTYYDHCWVIEEEPERILKKAKPYFLHELGYLLDENDKYIVLCSSMAFSGERQQWNFSGSCVILKSDIYKMEYLLVGLRYKFKGRCL